MAIIKCPSCGKDVSDEAPVCPHCGCKIAGNLVTCPECGQVYTAEHPNCPHCGAPRPASAFVPTKEDKRKTITIWIIILAVVVVAAAGYFFWQSTAQKSAEETAWEQCQNSTDTAVLGDFLRRYPDSEHYLDVKQRYDMVKGELQDWNNLQLSSSPSDFKDFFTKYPQSPFANLAKEKYDSLSWAQALVAKTPAAFQAYLDNVPDGIHRDEAQQQLTNLQNMKVTPDDEQNVAGVFRDFVTAFYNNNATGVTMAVSPVMTTFLNRPQVNKSEVIRVMNAAYEQTGGNAQVSVNNDFKVSKVNQGDGAYGYKATFTFDVITPYDDGTQEVATYRVTGSVTSDMHISVFNMRKI